MASATGSKIRFHYLNISFPFPHRQHLKAFLIALFKKEGEKLEALNYIFCDDSYLLTLNQLHLDHNTLTDIITFPLSFNTEPIVAEIYISIERVRENAQKFEVSFHKELYRVMFHGALHLCGYKDKKPAETQLMRKMEDVYLKRYLFHVEHRL
jgi:probable rRNA maturation factor